MAFLSKKLNNEPGPIVKRRIKDFTKKFLFSSDRHFFSERDLVSKVKKIYYESRRYVVCKNEIQIKKEAV